MTNVITSSAFFDRYAAIGAALFPIQFGKKEPTGIISSFKHDFSRDPAQWNRWYAEHRCNFGIVAFASGLIICDIDTKDGRDVAWADWCEVCRSWGLSEPLMPTVNTPSGGWHCYLRIPKGIDPASLRQPDALRGRINVRTIGYTVAAGSYYDGTGSSPHAGYYSWV